MARSRRRRISPREARYTRMEILRARMIKTSKKTLCFFILALSV
jgi:hypothetical protein